MTAAEIKERLKAVKYPGFTRDIVSFGIVRDIEVDDRRTQVRLALVTDNQDVVRQIVGDVETLLTGIEGLAPPDIVVERPQTPQASTAAGPVGHAGAAAGPTRGPRRVTGVSRLLAVASGKGGVGKSTVAANLACALAAEGSRVGLLDADIYGPSVPTLLGVSADERIRSNERGMLAPIERHGVRLVSMGFFVAEGAPLIWRGPMLTKALTQFLHEVDWGELDYLLIDLPPGTGDVQMTLTMQTALDAGIIVTTPQDVALADVERSVRMFQQCGAPITGLIENMSYHVCPCCGDKRYLFGEGGGRRMALRYGIPFLGEIPLVRQLRESGDAGRPIVLADPASEPARAFRSIAERVKVGLSSAQVGHA
jgi:ATP-binding protein involved in chromosome partitioning